MQIVISKLKTLYQIESLKYKTKGLKNTVIAIVLFVSMFYFAPIIGKQFWPQQIQDKELFIITRFSFFTIAMTILYALIYLPGYLGVSWYKQYLITPNAPKAWQQPDWSQKKMKTVKVLFLNKLVIVPFYYYTVTKLFGVRTTFDQFPTSWQIFKTIILIMIVDDFIYMWLHRIFHQIPKLYQYHKIHHSYNECLSFIGQYCHPIQQIFVNILSAVISFSLFKMHAFTAIFWICYKLYMSSEGHSLYEFPFCPFRILPFVYGPSYHDFHHTKNVGNYATSFYLLQFLLGTNKTFFDIQLKRLRKLNTEKEIKQN